jgi:hypothetical protein
VAYLKEISRPSYGRLKISTNISEELVVRQGFEGSAFGTEICIWRYVHEMRLENKVERDIRGLRVFEVFAVNKLNKTFSDLYR